MNEKALKEMCKWIIQNSNRQLTDAEKEMVKKAIDESKTIEELVAVGLAGLYYNGDLS